MVPQDAFHAGNFPTSPSPRAGGSDGGYCFRLFVLS
jgi:hypothetical protein